MVAVHMASAICLTNRLCEHSRVSSFPSSQWLEDLGIDELSLHVSNAVRPVGIRKLQLLHGAVCKIMVGETCPQKLWGQRILIEVDHIFGVSVHPPEGRPDVHSRVKCFLWCHGNADRSYHASRVRDS